MTITALLILVPGVAISYYLIGHLTVSQHRRWMEALDTLADVTTGPGHRVPDRADAAPRRDSQPRSNCRVIPGDASARIPHQVRAEDQHSPAWVLQLEPG